jgi:PAS domain S-box-containing protein/putative nucleotidyltransferase with HDIG domain
MNKPLRVLIVEDSESDAGLIVRQLQGGNYNLVYERVEIAEEMRAALVQSDWDIVIADYHLPRFSAPAALETLKESGRDVPCIIVSGTIGEEKAVAMMKAGAHDYLMKDNLARLVPAVERELREAEGRRERQRAEEALEESEERYRTLVENIDLGITLVSSDYRIIITNEAQARLLQKPISAIVGRNCFREFEQRDEVCAHCPGTRAMATGEKAVLETTGIQDNGNPIVVRLQAFPHRGSDGRITGFIEVVEDITERKQTEAALHESENLYRSLFENMLNGFAYCQMLLEPNQPEDFIYLKVNSSFEALTGLQDVVGKRVSEVIPGIQESDPALLEIYGRVASTGKPERFETYVKALKMWFSVSVYSPGKEHFVVVFDVITARKRVEEELRLKERMLDGASDSIFLHDIDGHFIYLNEAAYKSRGYEKGELVGKNIFALPTPEHAASRKQRLAELLKKGEVIFESAHFRKDGSIMPVEIQARIFDLDDRALILSAARDITERKQAEIQVRQGLEKLRQALQGTVVALANTVETKDPYTAGHQRRVAQLSCAMARELGWSPDQVEGIQVLCFLHDIGKIAVPAEILNKPGKISPMEFSLIKDHPQVGYNILKDIAFPWPVAQGVLQHHERLDGSGYPLGLTEEEISPEAKILAVADVVEAMASHRPYRPALGIDQALKEITDHKGKLYDPQAVEACIQLFGEREFRFD